ncbi:MAG: dTDP-4-amino-4,6-dideoxy-D-glucose ammonia-lyase [Angustibacter sp.]
MTVVAERDREISGCTAPGSPADAGHRALAHLLAAESAPTDDLSAQSDHQRTATGLISLARIYGSAPFTTLAEAQRRLRIDRAELAHLHQLFPTIPALPEAVLRGPAGKYWANTLLPLERKGTFDAVLSGQPAYPSIIGLYPGPTCMFRCHFCVRVTGARYSAAEVSPGNGLLADIIEQAPTDNSGLMYMSGGLEPLTNPELGDLVSRAARRGFTITLYTNSFALTENTLNRQPGLWDLGAVRTSLYGLSDEEYAATVQKPKAFTRVSGNLATFLELRKARSSPVKLGLSYLILPGRARRLRELADFVIRLSALTPDRPIDFLDLRQDYSGREDGQLSPVDRAELQDAMGAFDERLAEELPGIDVQYGYALNSLRAGVEADMLRITPAQMRPRAHPQVSVQVDLLGDVYLYREAGFPDLAGAHRYICGRVTPEHSLATVVTDFVNSRQEVPPAAGDEYFLDGFDQVITARLNQLESDLSAGWGSARGFLR